MRLFESDLEVDIYFYMKPYMTETVKMWSKRVDMIIVPY